MSEAVDTIYEVAGILICVGDRLLRMIASRVRTELDSSHKNLAAERARGNINLKNVADKPVYKYDFRDKVRLRFERRFPSL